MSKRTLENMVCTSFVVLPIGHSKWLQKNEKIKKLKILNDCQSKWHCAFYKFNMLLRAKRQTETEQRSSCEFVEKKKFKKEKKKENQPIDRYPICKSK